MIIAVGPLANEALASGHPDLALIDGIPVGASVCIFDARDEVWWERAAQRVCGLPKPRWFVVATDHGHREVMRRLAHDLDACVVAAHRHELLRAALLPLAGLVRPGVIGVDIAAVVDVCAAPSIAVASFDLDELQPSDSVLVVIRDPHISLCEINRLCERVAQRNPDADIVATAPLFEHDVPGHLSATGYLSVERLQPRDCARHLARSGAPPH